MDYTAFAFIRLFLKDTSIMLLHLGHFIINSASLADTISNSLLFEQTGHFTFIAMASTSSIFCLVSVRANTRVKKIYIYDSPAKT